MKDFWDLNLAPRFVQQISDDGFEYIGYYEILKANVCRIYVDKEAQNWKNSCRIATIRCAMTPLLAGRCGMHG
jgi:hypothetical protein